MGIAAGEEEVITSAYAAAVLMADYVPTDVFVIGSDGLRKEIAATGAHIVSRVDEPCDFLVVGFDRAFTYDTISEALDVPSCGAKFIACNRDAQFPVENSRFLPGCGAMVGAIEAVIGKKPDCEVGKPRPFMLKMVARRTNLRPEEILVIGDSLETDIAMAARFGSPSCLIGCLESASPRKKLRGKPISPTYQIDSLAALFEPMPFAAAPSTIDVA